MDGIEFPQEWTPGEDAGHIGKYRWASGRLYRAQCKKLLDGWYFRISGFDRNFGMMGGWGQSKECGPYQLQADCRAQADAKLREWIARMG